jgi:hypothetical protein
MKTELSVLLGAVVTAVTAAPLQEQGQAVLSEREQKLVDMTSERIVSLAAFDKAVPTRKFTTNKFLLIGFTLKPDGTLADERIQATNIDSVAHAEFLATVVRSVRLIQFSRVADSAGNQPALIHIKIVPHN